MPDLRERLLYPRAGWLSLGLLVIMGLALSWAVQGAHWLDQLEFLPPVAFWAILSGALLGVLPLRVVFTLPLAAIIGTAVVIWTIGGEYHPALNQLGRLQALRDDVVGWTITVLSTGYPAQMSPYAIGLGMLAWSTTFIASYAVYRHNRVIDAILLLGAAMIVNLSATFTDLFGHLLLFVIAALLLWLRAALVGRQDGWQRRRVNENLEVPAAIMRSGIIFAGASVILAWTLTSVAVAAPLTSAWRSFDGVWTGMRDQLEGVFGTLTNPQSRITGGTFGSSFTIQGEWVSNDDEVLTVAAPGPVYLRTATYDVYNGRGWERSDGTKRQVAPGDPLFAGATPERPSEAYEIETITISMEQTLGRNLFTAGSPIAVFAPIVIHESAGQPVLGGVEAANPIGPGEGYQIAVALSEANEAQLGAAGTDYPQVVQDLYLDDSRVTDRVRAEAQRVTEAAGATNPYEEAKALAAFLQRDPSFTYQTVAPVPEPGGDLVDFFLFDPESDRRGFCQYYASAMVMMARSLGLPARVAVGFAPGERTETTGGPDTFLVREANAHAWAEVYFPGYGWQIFESTKSIDSGFSRATGNPSTVAPPRTGVDPLLDFELDPALRRNISALPSVDFIDGGIDARNPDAPTAEDSARSGNLLLVAVLILGAVVFIWLRMRHLQRRWRLLPAGDRAWQRLTLAADRAGVGPRPSETIYEYSGWLEEQLPAHVEPIRTVADGKVWQAYSGQRMTQTATSRLEEAWARLRLPLVWLAVRRWLRGIGRRRT
ncbi:MAG TPA: transglutaminaseTgpA domain-containing protein [Candidatus Limnocylindrales bacterium]|nr:transglutaminaseTgpA domain-containing protein [Candidatus Limnocylindrales bacterium]